MTLSTGTRLGPYEIVAPLGAGGMGEVYRARDTRLGRDVAVKVLPGHLSSSLESRQRFEREAKTISQLTHPHICTLFDVGREADLEYLVMELLEGTTLADRLGKGALPVDQALRIGIEIAGALDAAHRTGIVHRDLKPGNVMLTKAGVKLLDFGLAKLAATDLTAVSQATSLPTALQESQPLTARGTILGTFQYMAPEQLEGREADARSDLFALGCVLYEMLTGRKAFSGKSQASLIGAIMNSEPPPISSIQPMTPPALDRVVKGCLEKEPEDRWNTAHDVMLQLKGIAEGGSNAGLLAPAVSRRRGRERLAWILAAAALVAASVATVGYLRRAPAVTAPIRAYLLPPPKLDFALTDLNCGSLTVSPNGRRVTFPVKTADGKISLWVQGLDEATARPIAGTEGAMFPFWSPDSRFIAFFSGGRLQKVDLAGAPPVAVCDATSGRSGSWSRDGIILFSPDSQSGIHRVAAGGGTSTPVTTLDMAHGETTHRWVTLLPDGRHFLYLAGSHFSGAKSEINAIYVGELGSPKKTLLMTARSNVAYASGHLLYMRENVLLAQPFDPAAQKLEGDPVPVMDGVQYDSGYFRGAFSVSDDGVLVYAAGAIRPKPRLVFLDRTGKPGEPIGEPAEYTSLSVSPDGTRFAAGIADPATGSTDLWLIDPLGGRTRFTSGGPSNFPAWSPDGSRIAYIKKGSEGGGLYVKRTDGTAQETKLFASNRLVFVGGWSPNGSLLSIDMEAASGSKTKSDAWIVPVAGGKPYPFLATESDEFGLTFSADGKWASYMSDETGRNEVYVIPFPGPGGRWQVSNAGTVGGMFVRGGKEVLYGDLENNAVSVEIRTKGESLEVGAPKVLFRMPSVDALIPRPDGQGFLVALSAEIGEPTRVGLMTNWPAKLRKE